jgi:hypothetical protein
MGFGAIALQPLLPAADRQHPVRAHLQLVIERLHRLVIERIFCILTLAGPDQRLMRVGEAGAFEIGHRVGLAPDDVVEDPEALVLQGCADAEDVVIAADNPDGAIGLQDATGLRQPSLGKAIITAQRVELVPIIVDRIDATAFRTEKVAA